MSSSSSGPTNGLQIPKLDDLPLACQEALHNNFVMPIIKQWNRMISGICAKMYAIKKFLFRIFWNSFCGIYYFSHVSMLKKKRCVYSLQYLTTMRMKLQQKATKMSGSFIYKVSFKKIWERWEEFSPVKMGIYGFVENLPVLTML